MSTTPDSDSENPTYDAVERARIAFVSGLVAAAGSRLTATDRNKLARYRPYPKQKEFHNLGKTKTERLLSAGNQLGKTVCGAHEAAFHATGRYPDWWDGRVWKRATRGWVGGETGQVVRDTSQKLLLGDLSAGLTNLGRGIIPHDTIVDFTWSRGVAQAVDTLVVRHVSGKNSVIRFKSYDQGRQKWQGDTIDWTWLDEEPPPDVYTEALARFTATDGLSWMTFTPLKGMSTVVKRFYSAPVESRAKVTMTVHDAKHITPDMLKRMLEKYPEHEHDTRINGTPMHGEGRVFQFDEKLLRCEPFSFPDYWKHIVGLDLGHGSSEQAHPTAAVWLAIDPDQDVWYLYRHYIQKGGNIPTHAMALKANGPIPVAWPADAVQADKSTGASVASHYKNAGVNMLPGPARWPDGSVSVWQGVVEITQRAESGRFKVFPQCLPWFEEFRNYHMEDGKIVPIDDDLLSATRYAFMMAKRYAKSAKMIGQPRVNRMADGVMDFSILKR